ncbi:RNA 2',3'-cyclic phosphodiesterase [Patescibacteria group bacterium]|nr:RNA 2',3'-cyclic phosphodiesterase [Patescibacteria group bacterium]
MRRFFIAISIPKEIKYNIAKKRDVLETMLPWAKFTSEDNWHITISFLGMQEDESIISILKAIQETVSEFKPSEINLSDISYAPPKGTPRMIWLNIQDVDGFSEYLSFLKFSLEDKLIKNGVRFKLDNREFSAHITLAKFSRSYKEKLPELDQRFTNFNWFFEAEGLDLIESYLSEGGAKHEIVQKNNFND